MIDPRDKMFLSIFLPTLRKFATFMHWATNYTERKMKRDGITDDESAETIVKLRKVLAEFDEEIRHFGE